MKLVVGLVLAAAVLAVPARTAAGPQARAGTIMQWTIDGVQRSAIVFAPAPTTSAVKHPLVFGFHGHGGGSQGTSMQMHIQTLWPQAIVVYPQGLPSPTPKDPNATLPGWQFKSGDNGNRDLKLFDAMVKTMSQKYGVDKRRVYTTGFSNGGIFSYLLWAERAKTIAAIAAIAEVAGSLDASESLTTRRAALAIGGTADATNPFSNQQQSIDRARQADGATGAGTPCGQGCTLYTSSPPGTPVKTLIRPGGHVYPPWAPAVTVAFFKAHPQP